MTAPLPRIALLLAVALRLSVSSLTAQDEPPDFDVDSSPDTPREASSAPQDEISAAIERARSALREAEEAAAAEAESLGAEIASVQSEIGSLRDAERAHEREIERLRKAILAVDGQLAEAETEEQTANDEAKSVRREVESQAVDLRDRFATSLLAAEKPGLIERIRALVELDDALETRAAIDELLAIGSEVLGDARSWSTFRTEVRLPGVEGDVQDVDVLRLGLLAGYYSHGGAGDSGFVLGTGDTDARFEGESVGLTVAQRAQIAAAIQDPARGILLPMDVTGGAGLATLRGQVSLARWFETGGVFMWPLLVLAVIVLLLVVERAVRLSLLSAGIRRRVALALELVSSGRADEAEERFAESRSVVGQVLRSALVHRDQPRSVLEDAVQESLLHHAPRFHTRLGFIALGAAIAPLIGLLGTVTGMITTFRMITLFGTSDPRFMAGGISEALITTQAGLCVAIPALVFRGILGSVAESALGSLESGVMSVVLAILRDGGADSGSDDDEARGGDDDTDELDLEYAFEDSELTEAAARVSAGEPSDGTEGRPRGRGGRP